MKKVLIVSNNALSSSYNNGRTLNAIFSDFKKGSISQIFFNDERPESNVAESFYRITGREQFVSFFKKDRYSAGHTVERKSNVESEKKAQSLVSRLTHFVNSYLGYSKLFLRDFLYSFGIRKNQKLYEWAVDQNPEMLFFVVGNSKFSINFSIDLASKLNIPIFVYITDDYVIHNRPVKSIIGKLYHSSLFSSYERLFDLSKGNFFIGQYMKEEFNRVFGVTGECLINCNLVEGSRKTKFATNRKVKVVYAGGLHLGRTKSLLIFADIMKSICSVNNYDFSLEVYTNENPKALLSSKAKGLNVNYRGSLPWNELQHKLIDADFLLHVESFEPKVRKKTQLSLSTKIPEYMSTGTCILAFGPKEIASIKLFLDEPVGVAVVPNDQECLERLERALTDIFFREEISVNALRYSEKAFSPRVIQSRLIAKLSEV
ncbi:hypothetical protein ACP7H9_09630 [Idiomarina sp. ST20R2A10]|uniref:hypothetical protein n=1 Tax=Idiomarina sp. ST20R2A10 TaxID=3418369 RepID=UPI003EC74463